MSIVTKSAAKDVSEIRSLSDTEIDATAGAGIVQDVVRVAKTIWRAITGDQHNGTGNGQGTGGGNQDGKG